MKANMDGATTSFYGTPPFKMGDKVKLAKQFYFQPHRDHEHNIIRTVLQIKRGSCASKWWVITDGGEPCKCCGLTAGVTIRADSGWFIKT